MNNSVLPAYVERRAHLDSQPDDHILQPVIGAVYFQRSQVLHANQDVPFVHPVVFTLDKSVILNGDKVGVMLHLFHQLDFLRVVMGLRFGKGIDFIRRAAICFHRQHVVGGWRFDHLDCGIGRTKQLCFILGLINVAVAAVADGLMLNQFPLRPCCPQNVLNDFTHTIHSRCLSDGDEESRLSVLLMRRWLAKGDEAP